MREDISKEFGKWLMDIAKYVVTAIVISSFLGSFGETWLIYVFGILTATAFLLSGFWYLGRKTKINNMEAFIVLGMLNVLLFGMLLYTKISEKRHNPAH